MTTERQALEGAVKRGMIDDQVKQQVAATRLKRICPTCGQTFRAHGVNYKGFCCACCALTHLTAHEKGKITRAIKTGVDVIVIETGKRGKVLAIPDREHALVEVDGVQATYGPKEIEKIQYLPVTHMGTCGKALSAQLTALPVKKIEPVEEKES